MVHTDYGDWRDECPVPTIGSNDARFRTSPHRKEPAMHPETLFQIHLVAGYAAWLLCFGAYVWPWLRSLERDAALRAIATLHGFRFFGLVFILPGVVGSGLPGAFATPTAWGDFATALLALLALALFRVRPLFRA